jgi:hypothetical protein
MSFAADIFDKVLEFVDDPSLHTNAKMDVIDEIIESMYELKKWIPGYSKENKDDSTNDA